VRRAAAVAAIVLVACVEPGAQTGTRRVVAIADVHGAYDSFREILRQTGLIDESGRWSGGQATLVQTGDVTDRGLGFKEALDLLRALERQARDAGGRVIPLLGNHEAMNMTRFVRDVSPEAYPLFADARSEERRRDAYRRYVRLVAARRSQLGGDPFTVLDEAAWMAAHPPGMIEYLTAFGPDGDYGEWLRERDAIARVGGTIFLHGGLNPETATLSIDDMNSRVRAEVRRFDNISAILVERDVILPFFTFDETLEAAKRELDWWMARLQAPAVEPVQITPEDRDYLRTILDLINSGAWSIISPDGPLWYRGFAQWTDEQGQALMGDLLGRFGASRIVVGHTPTPNGRIVPRFDQRVFMIDTGMLASVYKGRASAFEIVNGEIAAIYTDGRTVLNGAEAAAGAR